MNYRKVLLIVTFLLVPAAAGPSFTGPLFGQESWYPADSIVHVYTVNEKKETLVPGIVFLEHEGKAYVLAPDLYYGRGDDVLPPELTATSQLVSSEVSVVVRAGTLATEFIPAERLYSARQTGLDGYEVIVADAGVMPPPVKFGDFSGLTEGDQLTLQSVEAEVVNNEWVFSVNDQKLSVEQLIGGRQGNGGEPARVVAEAEREFQGRGFVFDENGNWLGDYRSGASFAGLPEGHGMIQTRELERVKGIGPFLMTRRGFQEQHYDGYTLTLDFYFGVSPLTSSPQSVEALFEQTQDYRQGSSREFDGPPEVSALNVVPRERWNIAALSDPESGEPPEEYPFAELWHCSVKFPVKYAFVNWRKVDLRYQFRVNGEVDSFSVHGTSFYPKLAPVTSFRPVDIEGDKPLLLTVDDTRAQGTELARAATVSRSETRSRSIKVDEGTRGIFPYVRIEMANQQLIEPFVFNDRETHVAMATSRGQIFFADARSWELMDVKLTVNEGILTVGTYGGDLFVVTKDRSRILRINTAAGEVVSEIGLPINFRRGGPDNPGGRAITIYDTRLIFHPASEVGFVVSNNDLISINLRDNVAGHWLKIGSNAQDVGFGGGMRRQGQVDAPQFQFSNDGCYLIARGPVAFYRIAVSDTELTLEKKIDVVNNIEQFAIAGDDLFVGCLGDRFENPAMTPVTISSFSPAGEPAQVGNDSRGNTPYLHSLAFDQQQQLLFVYEGGFNDEVIAIRNLTGELTGSISESESSRMSERRIEGGNLTFLPQTRRLISGGTKSGPGNNEQLFYVYEIPAGLGDSSAASSLYPEPVSVNKNWLAEREPVDVGNRVALEPVIDEMSWPPAWSRDGGHLYFSDHGGTIYKLRASDWTVTAEFNLGSPFGPIKRCSSGLLAPNPDAGTVLLLDEDLNVQRAFNCDRPYHVASSPGHDHFIVGSAEFPTDRTMRSTGARSVTHLALIDLEDGVVWQSPADYRLSGYLQSRMEPGSEINLPSYYSMEQLVLSSDGAKLFTLGSGLQEFAVQPDGISYSGMIEFASGGSRRQFFDAGDGHVGAAADGNGFVQMALDIEQPGLATVDFEEHARSPRLSGSAGNGRLAMGHARGFSLLDRNGGLIGKYDVQEGDRNGQFHPAFSPDGNIVILMMEDRDRETRLKFNRLYAFELDE